MNDSVLPAELGAWVQPLLGRLHPRAVQRLARTLAMELRRQQSRRIAAQRNPDGTAYAPRGASLRLRPTKGAQWRERERVKAMFTKLRTSAHLKARSSAQEAVVQIEGRSARIARVHQFGLLDRPQAGGPRVHYPVRVLLGWSDGDLAVLADRVRAHLE